MSDAELHAALTRRLYQRATASGSITLPAVPSMLDEYVKMCDRVFLGIGVRFAEEELDALRDALASQLAEAFTASPRSTIVITYDSPTGLSVNYHVKAEWAPVDVAYEHWISTREPPLFGAHPDARVMAFSDEVKDPAEYSVLDLGAGTGRNTLALARRGHLVDAVEVTPSFANTIREEAEPDGLAVRVLERDIFAAADDLRDAYDLIVLSEVASDFRSTEELRAVFELAASRLAPGGHLVMNAFIARDVYVPDAAARQLGQQCYTSMFTRDEVLAATSGLPLCLVSDESVYEYEREHLPVDAWPPTSWFERWVSGQDVFDVQREASPIELRWLVFGAEG